MSDRHLPITRTGFYNNSNTSASSLGSINININYSEQEPLSNYSNANTPSRISLLSSNSSRFGSSQHFQNSDNPTLLHRWSHNYSVLSVTISRKKKVLFCGTQDSQILIFNLRDFQKIGALHTENHGAILRLTVSNNENFLFATSSDSLIKVWDISKIDDYDEGFELSDYIHELTTIYSLMDIGDIFSIALSKNLNIVFFGCQNASIQWVDFSDKSQFIKMNKQNLNNLPFIRYDKFFDSKPGVRSSEKNSKGQVDEKIEKFSTKLQQTNKKHLTLIETPVTNVMPFAHNGFIYDLKIVPRSVFEGSQFPRHSTLDFQEYLISVGGDGLAKIWGIHNTVQKNQQIEYLTELDNEEPSISITLNGIFLYCGLSGGKVKVWDLSTFQLIKVISEPQGGEINSLAYYPALQCLFKATEHGCCKYNLPASTTTWRSSEQQVLAVDIIENYNGNLDNLLITAGSGGVCVWNLPSKLIETNFESLHDNAETSASLLSDNSLLKVLSSFVSYKTVSQKPEQYIEESRSCANFLHGVFRKYGAAESKLFAVENGNPVVYALFKANNVNSDTKTPRVAWYGHYDVVGTDSDKKWTFDPFTLTAQDGYLYARGVSDNKGPILATIFAVAELSQRKQLSADVVFLIEGEEEAGSFGFQKSVQKHKDLIGPIDWVLFSNSYWLDDHTPCLNYGLRGMISVEVEVQSEKPDRHSGVDGGVYEEPTMDLVNLLSTLTDKATGKIQLPDFYKPILPISKEELAIYEEIVHVVKSSSRDSELSIKNLLKKWRLPSLTVHRVRVSGPKNTTIIPKTACASISLRVVPNQCVEKIKQDLVSHLVSIFASFNSENTLKITFLKETEPWLGDLNNAMYRILHQELHKEWKTRPLYIREGGSIPSIRFMETFFGASAAQIPCGQSSDDAHLNNERLRIINLFKLKKILGSVFAQVPNNIGKREGLEGVKETQKVFFYQLERVEEQMSLDELVDLDELVLDELAISDDL